jgi:hypothetical protein
VGEIGIDRNDFLHRLKWWEIRSIIRGYSARYHASWEQARLIAYHVRYCMGVRQGEVVKSIKEWIPFSWEKPEEFIPSDEELDEVQKELDMYKQIRDDLTSVDDSENNTE